MESTTETRRAFLLGFDGVPWYLLERWINEDELPNFAKLYDEGAAGPLQSTTPDVTALAWPSISTGVWPDKHGVYAFQRLSDEYTHRVNTRRDIEQPELWDMVSPSVVGNVPMTYPADDIDGTMVTGMMTPNLNERFTHPPSLREEILEQLPDYQIGLTWSEYADRQDEFLDDISSLLAGRRRLMHMLMEQEWRLFYFVFTAPDRIQHLLWNDEILLDHYKQLDDILGDVLSAVEDANSNLFVVSDHGFGPVSKVVSVNRVLEEEGYLTRQTDNATRGVLTDLGITKDSVLSRLKTVGIDQETLVNRLPEQVVSRVAERVPGDHVLFDVDFPQTVAFVHGSGCCYINTTDRFAEGIVEPADVPELTEELAAVFRNVTDPETGERALRVYEGDELFETDDRAPDLIVRGQNGYEKSVSLTDEVFNGSGATKASHRPEGVFLAWGPDVRQTSVSADSTVVDVAPTVLHSMNESIPSNVDGSVLDIFRPDSDPARRDVEFREYGEKKTDDDAHEDFDEVEERLRGLGYMD
ncbi:alkaline phosphatase family protein [Haloarchaeobius sp. DFWS5]|uniref:alkaline phosphatase family protein n=1 Tax=Haloarchaeobius sp. DFWS5 TaxID=3446114 RepID=UPI003EBE5D0C